MSDPRKNTEFEELIRIVKLLRSPDGCPWDREQTSETLKPHLIEEAHEVLEAIDSDDPADLCEELGDLLFQVLFHSEIASEKGDFDIHDVCSRITQKMVRRHPHVFGDENFSTSDELLKNWERLKSGEKRKAGKTIDRQASILEGIPPTLPALHVARLISAKAAGAGFDWPDLQGIEAKLNEEVEELNEAVFEGASDKIQEEIGDILFTAVNIARSQGIDPESALTRANRKFKRRFQALERHFRESNQSMNDASLEELESVWVEIKNIRKQQTEE